MGQDGHGNSLKTVFPFDRQKMAASPRTRSQGIFVWNQNWDFKNCCYFEKLTIIKFKAQYIIIWKTWFFCVCVRFKRWCGKMTDKSRLRIYNKLLALHENLSCFFICIISNKIRDGYDFFRFLNLMFLHAVLYL